MGFAAAGSGVLLVLVLHFLGFLRGGPGIRLGVGGLGTPGYCSGTVAVECTLDRSPAGGLAVGSLEGLVVTVVVGSQRH